MISLAKLAGTRSLQPSSSSLSSSVISKKPSFCSFGPGRGKRLNFGSGFGRICCSSVDYGGIDNEEEEEEGELGLVRTLLIDNYDSYTYNIYQYLSVINGAPPVVVFNDEWSWDYARRLLLEQQAFDNVVISPGPGSPECPGDIGICLQLLLECPDIPVLGVCLGHQALGYAHGARVVHAPEPVHGRLSEIQHTGGDLFLGIPSGSKSGFKVVRYHSLTLEENTLPKQLIPIAWTTPDLARSLSEKQETSNIPIFIGKRDMETLNSEYFTINGDIGRKKEKILMGIRHATRPHYGVQFHPESIATSYGRQIFRNFKRLTVKHGLRSYSLPAIKVHKKAIAGAADAVLSSKQVKLHWKKLDGLAKKIGGSANIFVRLFGDRQANDTFWLDSSSTEQRRARFSFMGGKGGPIWKQITFWLSDQRGGGYLSVRHSSGQKKTVFLENGFLNYMDKELQSFEYCQEDYQSLPFDFMGGFVGYIGYNLKTECGASSNSHKSPTPDACFFFADDLIVVDHDSDDVYLLSLRDSSFPQSAWIEETEKKLYGLIQPSNGFDKRPITPAPDRERFVPEKPRIKYMKDVERCQEFIRDGESYELCLTTQMKMRVGREFDALAAYLDLRERNPAPFAAWLSFPDEDLRILCSSPERFLRLDGDGMLEAKPIKGTVARGQTPAEDRRLKHQLIDSEKDQAENLMIVDLLRNDLGRVCEPGTVRVPHLMKVESYATVHTLVSTVQGQKQRHLTPVDCVRAAFPGGSMTGAPKLRSMELLDAIESSARGIYSGSIGFFSYNQRFDLNIVIRTVVLFNGEASIGAGGAIVALSNPGSEYEEMLLKSTAPAGVIEEHLQRMKINKEETMNSHRSVDLGVHRADEACL